MPQLCSARSLLPPAAPDVPITLAFRSKLTTTAPDQEIEALFYTLCRYITFNTFDVAWGTSGCRTQQTGGVVPSVVTVAFPDISILSVVDNPDYPQYEVGFLAEGYSGRSPDVMCIGSDSGDVVFTPAPISPSIYADRPRPTCYRGALAAPFNVDDDTSTNQGLCSELKVLEYWAGSCGGYEDLISDSANHAFIKAAIEVNCGPLTDDEFEWQTLELKSHCHIGCE